jgi:hypothetical protein
LQTPPAAQAAAAMQQSVNVLQPHLPATHTLPPALVAWHTVQLVHAPPPVPQAVLSVPETHEGYGALVEQPPLQAATQAPVATSQKPRLQPSTLLLQPAALHWWVALLHACSCGQSAAVRHGTQARETQ